MPEHTQHSYTHYLKKLTAGLPHLSAAQRLEIEQELLAHLEDVASEMGVDPTDAAVQDQVLNSLGGTSTLISAFTEAYDRRPRLPVVMSFLLNGLGGGGFLALSATFLVHEYVTGAYRRSVLATAQIVERWDQTSPHLSGALARSLSGLPHPLLYTLLLVGVALMGMLIMGAAMRYRQLSPDGYQMLLRASLSMLLCTLLCFVLFQGAAGTITMFYTLFGVASLGGLLVAGLIEHDQRQTMVNAIS